MRPSLKVMIRQINDEHREKKTLKVINITEEGRYGGPQSRIAKVAGVLKDMGVETTVVCPVIDSDILINELKKTGISCMPIRLHRMTLQLSHLIGFVIFFLPEVLSLRKLLIKNKSDVIHCNGCWQIKGMIAARLAKTGAPVVYHLNDTNTLPVIKIVFTFLASQMVDAFIPSCQRSRDYYLKDSALKGRKNYIINPPVDTDRFHPDTVTADAGIAKLPGIKIMTVCNVNYGKGIEELIEVCDVLSKQFPPLALSFCVVGPVHQNHAPYFGKLKREMKEKQIENFYFTGPSNNVPAALKAADIFVCTSHFEAGPMTVFEAMSMGMPIVSTDVGDVKNYLEQGQCGFCVPVGNIEEMAEKISILIQDKALRTRMGKNARDFAVGNLDLKICAQRHALFYRELAELNKWKNEVT